MIVRAPAKINIALAVGLARPDGYHDVDTIYQAVDVPDVVSATGSSSLQLQITGSEAATLAADSSNLAWRAAVLMAKLAGREPALSLVLEKNIPIAAGLAGGSADAAAVLVAVDALWRLGLSGAELTSVAAELGSDVSFALIGGTARGTGRGEQLAALATTSSPLHWVLAVSAGQLATPEVYGELDRQRRTEAAAPRPLYVRDLTGGIEQVRLLMRNDLQAAAFALSPGLAKLLQSGLSFGALAGQVSGSGPTLMFLAADDDHASRLAQRLSAQTDCRYALAVRGDAPGACDSLVEIGSTG